MKKLIALLLACVMVLGLVACGGSETPATEAPAADSDTPATEAPAANEGDTAASGSVYYLNFKPEFDEALQSLAADYTAETGVPVKVVTAASGTYSDTLNANIEDVTIYNIGNMAGLADWDDYALDLTDTAIAAELATNEFNLYNEAGELKAIGNCYESYGIIVNTELLATAGYSLDDIYNFETLKAVADDIHARASELGFDAFTSAGLDGSSSWRFSGHLAGVELHYEGVNSSVAEITGECLDLFKNVWDLYITDSSADPTSLSTSTGDESTAMFKEGKAVFYQNGTWEYSGLIEAGMTDDQLAMIPIYCGAEGEENAALCSGTENCWAINSKAAEEDIQASINFLVWLVSDPEASAVYVEQLGAVPFKNCPASTNKFVNDGNALLADGKYNVTWGFNYTPNVDSWRATVVTALAAYSAGTAEWSAVEEAFVDGWAYEYSVVNG
ncbi:MAG: ABC transporter substrate-binding protein [Oscillospiraceae bacterium]|nr:ABC transporter substrate-binding protein [Oscillospiraceae bacterium]